jgi:cell shape-determining protein MreD
MGFVWDALQGGIIEVATFKMPFVVFLVDSGFRGAPSAASRPSMPSLR